jgi:hypothetical protein
MASGDSPYLHAFPSGVHMVAESSPQTADQNSSVKNAGLVAVSLLINDRHGVALTPTNVYLCPLLLVNLNVNFPVEGSSVPEKIPSSIFAPIMS